MVKDEILTAQAAAELLGTHIETVRRLARKGGIPAFKVGKDWRFSGEALRRWVIGQQEARQAHPRVLAVDDEAAITKLIHHSLTPLGCVVIQARSGAEGLDIAALQPLDLVTVDLKMPEMDGAEFIARFRELQKDTPVIVVTGHPESDLMDEAMRFGPLLLVRKPVEKAALHAAVRLALQGRLVDAEGLSPQRP